MSSPNYYDSNGLKASTFPSSLQEPISALSGKHAGSNSSQVKLYLPHSLEGGPPWEPTHGKEAPNSRNPFLFLDCSPPETMSCRLPNLAEAFFLFTSEGECSTIKRSLFPCPAFHTHRIPAVNLMRTHSFEISRVALKEEH